MKRFIVINFFAWSLQAYGADAATLESMNLVPAPDVTPASLSLSAKPGYPPAALLARQEGKVIVVFMVDMAGFAREVKVLASPSPELGENTKAIIETWHFQPAEHPVHCARAIQPARVTVSYDLAADPDPVKVESLELFEAYYNLGTFPGSQLPAGLGATPSTEWHAEGNQLPNVLKLVAIKQVTPKWPEKALREKIEGEVLLQMRISAEGVVDAVRVIQSEPPGLFDESALSAVREWRFKPALVNGNAISRTACFPLAFRLGAG